MDASDHIGWSIETARERLAEEPQEARTTDSAASAVVQDGLRVRVEGPEGGATIYTDMPVGVGGAATAPSPGWYARAGHASCQATLITMRAAELGIALQRVEVIVDGESDDRGFLAVDDAVPVGPLSSRTRVRIAAVGVDTQLLLELVEWAHRHSPVADAIRRAIPMSVVLESPGGRTVADDGSPGADAPGLPWTGALSGNDLASGGGALGRRGRGGVEGDAGR